MVDFADPVMLEQPGPQGIVELITTELRGEYLVGDPDPAFPNHNPVYTSDGKRIGWVRTGDIPR
jgi:hypothetical protein